MRAGIPGATMTPVVLDGIGDPARIAPAPDGSVWFIAEGRKPVGNLTISGSIAAQTTDPITLSAGQTVHNFARAIAGGPLTKPQKDVAALRAAQPAASPATQPTDGRP